MTNSTKSKTCCVIGHGDSLNTNLLGYIIDRHDYVIRIKNGIELSSKNPASFGSKTTHVVIPTNTLSGPIDIEAQASLYDDSVVKYIYAIAPFQSGHKFINADDKIAHWLAQFKLLSSGQAPYFSTGTAAVIYACTQRDINTLALFGFDAYRHPGHAYKNAFGKQILVGHEWALERLLVEEICADAKITLVFIE